MKNNDWVAEHQINGTVLVIGDQRGERARRARITAYKEILPEVDFGLEVRFEWTLFLPFSHNWLLTLHSCTYN